MHCEAIDTGYFMYVLIRETATQMIRILTGRGVRNPVPSPDYSLAKSRTLHNINCYLCVRDFRPENDRLYVQTTFSRANISGYE